MSTTPLDQPLRGQLRDLLAQNDPTSVPSGVLLWFGDTDLPDGAAADPPLFTAPEWTAMYVRLLGAARSNVLPPPLSALPGRAAEPGRPIPLQIAAVDFERFTPSAAAEIRRAAAAGETAQLPTSLAASLESAHAFAATLVLAPQFVRDVPVVRGRHVTLALDSDGLTSNGAPITDVTVDAHDGVGPRPLTPGQTLDLAVDTASLDLTIAASVGGVRRTAACTVTVVDDAPPSLPDEVVPLATEGGRTGRLLRFRPSDVPAGGAPDRWRAPVLVAEGFPGSHSPEYLSDMLGQHELLDRLRAAGRDVAVIGFDQGSDTMQPNADVVRAAIEHVLARTDDELVVSGWSMGGLITRFALADMEHRGVDHRTAVYLSVDTPHGRGAYTTVAGQWCCEQLPGLSPAIDRARTVLTALADQQFLALYVDGDTVGPAPLRQQFLADLADVGWYPQRPRRFAVACGSGDGAARVPVPAEPMLTWETDGFGDLVLEHLVDDGTVTIGTGASLGALDADPQPVTTHSAVCWEIMPGSRERYFDLVVEPIRSLGIGRVQASLELGCAMPTVSALDLATDPRAPIPAPGTALCPFHDYTTSASDQRHLQLTPAVVDWIIDRIDLRPTDTNGEHRP